MKIIASIIMICSLSLLSNEIYAQSRPDLIITYLNCPHSGTQGQKVTVKLNVKNQGNVSTYYSQGGVFDIAVYLSTNTTINTLDKLVCSFTQNEITAGQTISYTLANVTIPSDIADNTYYWGAIADVGGFVVESDESNNTRYDATPIIIGTNRVRDINLVLPTSYSLEQNFPNPFNPSTTISFNLPSKSFVSLKVYDLLGREVATIISEEMSAGNYSRQWNAAALTSGVYFYRLQAGSFAGTKKLVLLR
ncbi:MAG: T9SS type A sorting domain-containing protein [Bacteroidota bacterium]|jgi:hypothetical protein